MPIYEFKCPIDGIIEEQFALLGAYVPPTCECGTLMRRKFSFAVQAIFESHYNITVGDVVNSKSDMSDKLKRKSDEASERSGIASSFSMIDSSDIAPSAAQAESKSRRDLASGKRDAKIIV